MSRALRHGLLVFALLFSVVAAVDEIEFPHCNCNGGSEGAWSIESILQSQKVSDFLIATAYFSIPLELLYFVTCSSLFPFKWILFQFGAFIVLCGLTHLLNVFTYEPHSFLLMLSLTISKFLTALVSFATAITLLTLIPQLLRVKVRENLLRQKARELDREVGMMKRKEEASWHVRMLTQEIRKSLDRHTILYTTLVELSKTLELQNCAVWMPDEDKMEMNLTHELRPRDSLNNCTNTIPITDLDVMEIRESKGVKILRPDSVLGSGSTGGGITAGPVAAIRMPLLNVSNFKGGTPQVIQASYAILVLVLPRDGNRVWSRHELEIVEVVADQVAVALSHAAVLEESQSMRDKLAEQNRTLLQAKQNALMANEARDSFQKVMSRGMRQPIHSIMGMLSMMQQEKMNSEQKLLVDTIVKTSSVVSTLINDVTEISTINRDRLVLEMRPFNLHSIIKEAASAVKSVCDTRGYGFGIQVENEVPARVVGDEKRIFQVILHMFGNLVNECGEGSVTFWVSSGNELGSSRDQRQIPWKLTMPRISSSIKFEIAIKRSKRHDSSSLVQLARRPSSEGLDMGLSFSMCKKLVQLMQGNIWTVPNSRGFRESMILVLQLQQQHPNQLSEVAAHFERHNARSASLLQGLRVLLVDDDDVNRVVTGKLLEKLGCHVTSVSSGFECLTSLGTSMVPFRVIILDLHMPKMDGFEVTMRIRKFASWSKPLIVALTASDKEDVLERCLQSGMNGLIRKPVMLQAMGDELYRVLQNT